MRRFKIDEETAKTRLDVFCANKLPNLSRAFVQRLIDEGKILVNKAPEKPGYKLREGDKITIDFEEQELDKIPDIEMPILYEDENVLVVNKPVGVISHARGRYWNEPSVASFIRQKTGLEGERAGIVHRLDRVTSGVMICSKNSETLSYLQKQFSVRKVRKTYVAIVKGTPEPKAAIIDMPIERNPKKPQAFRVGKGGRPSITHYEVTKSNDEYSMLVLKPETGRTHQLRVHLAKLGFPIVGDILYEGPEADRLYLHAEQLEITLPGGKRITLTAKLPPEFAKMVA